MKKLYQVLEEADRRRVAVGHFNVSDLAALAASPDEIAPYKILPAAVEAVEKVVRSRLELFNSN